MMTAGSDVLLDRSEILRISREAVCTTTVDGPENVFACAPAASSCASRVMISYIAGSVTLPFLAGPCGRPLRDHV